MVVFEKLEHDDVLGLRFGHKLIGRPKLLVYLYYIDGLLIDTGQSKLRSRILRETQELEVDQMLITHYHEDHSGNILPLKERYQCTVYASDSCSQMMKDPPKISWVQKMTWGDREPVADLKPVGPELRTPKYHLEVMPIPGHSPDMIALYEPNRRWLFSADLYIHSYIGYFLRNESILEQINSLKMALKLDIEILFCSHQPLLSNPNEHLRKKLNFLESFYSKVATLRGQGFDARGIFKAMGLKENRFVKTLSGGQLSKMNMVESALRDHDRMVSS